MSEDLIWLIRREVSRMMQTRSAPRIGTVTSYDPQKHAVKVKLQPEGVETGWIPIAAAHVGNGVGIAVGPQPDDQFMVHFHEDDPDSAIAVGRVFSDKDQPPVAQAGEIVIQTQAGVVIKADKDGNLSIATNGKPIAINGGSGAMTITAGSLNINTSGQLKHNGVNVGSTHVHTNVQPGPSNTGGPT